MHIRLNIVSYFPRCFPRGRTTHLSPGQRVRVGGRGRESPPRRDGIGGSPFPVPHGEGGGGIRNSKFGWPSPESHSAFMFLTGENRGRRPGGEKLGSRSIRHRRHCQGFDRLSRICVTHRRIHLRLRRDAAGRREQSVCQDGLLERPEWLGRPGHSKRNVYANAVHNCSLIVDLPLESARTSESQRRISPCHEVIISLIRGHLFAVVARPSREIGEGLL